MNERGFASPLMLASLALLALFCLAFSDVAAVLVARSRAVNAADAAALSAAVAQWPYLGGGKDAAQAAGQSATSNGARLVSCDCPLRGSRVVVVVAVRTNAARLRVAPAEVRASAVARIDSAQLFRSP